MLLLGIIGAAMFLGDSVITPAISVLSAVEGLKLATPALEHYVLPLTIVILIVLFAVQRRGTARGRDILRPGDGGLVRRASRSPGAMHLRDDPARVRGDQSGLCRRASSSTHGHIGLVTLGAVFLAVTGGEALYADLGHFGRKPIQRAWLGLVLPALLINYFGQGALVLAHPTAIENPFYRLVPEAAAAAAGRAGDRRHRDRQPGRHHRRLFAGASGDPARPAAAARHRPHLGGIFRPDLSAARQQRAADRRLLLVGLFHTSSALASAYGIAVATTMVVDGVLGFIVIWKLWQWPAWQAALLMVPLVVVDATFFSANLLKLLEGAWVPLLFGISMVMLILTWRRGTRILANKTRRTEVPLEALLHSLEKKPPHIVPGTAVFLTSDPDFAPTALLHNLKHNKVLHEQNVILTIITDGHAARRARRSA